ncbi:hypothetical protein ACHAXS_007045 [Conticribra weissflogii]
MGRKKGKQCGEFQRKSQNAANRHLLYVDHASEANGYRNPVKGFRGGGYRNTFSDDCGGSGGQWCGREGRGGSGSGDKWSSVFSHSRVSRGASDNNNGSESRNSNSTTAVTIGLSRLRFLLEERRIDDRAHDREFRLRLHRTRAREIHLAGREGMARIGRRDTGASQVKGDVEEVARHEPGWLVHGFDNYSGGSRIRKANEEHKRQQFYLEQTDSKSVIPSLQTIAAKVLASHLHAYVETCGHVFVGECFKSVHADVISDLSISLAKLNSFPGISDGIVKAFAHAGSMNGLVLRGPMRGAYDHDDEGEKSTIQYMTDEGLLSLCPRLLPSVECPTQNSLLGRVQENDNKFFDVHAEDSNDDDDDDSVDDWEKLDVESDLTSRMAGCFHLKRLELIHLPLAPTLTTSDKHIPGISLRALRQVFKSCPSITHLSLSGCFHNWEEVEYSSSYLHIVESENVTMLLCGVLCEKGVISHMVNEFQKLDYANCRFERGISQSFLEHIFRSCKRGCEGSAHDGLGLDTLLPELQVLDVSHCSWVTPSMILQFALQCWKRAYFSQATRVKESGLDFDWMDRTIHTEGGNVIAEDWKEELLSKHSCGERIPQISTKLRYLNVLGCEGFASSQTPSQVRGSQDIRQRVEEWNNYGIFHGINLSAECHQREG